MINEGQVENIVYKVLEQEHLAGFVKIFEKEHNLFRGSHDKIGLPEALDVHQTIVDHIIDKTTLDQIADGTYAKALAESLDEGKILLSEALGSLDSIANGTTYGRVLLADLSGGHIILGTVEGDLDDIDDGSTYGKILLTDISAGHILLASVEGDLDDVSDGSSYGKVALTDISAGHILLATCDGDLDDIANGTSYGRVAITDISAGHILLATCDGDLDDVGDGSTYSKVLATDISAGHILLAACDGDLDDVGDGSSYGKVAVTSISAGKIIIAGMAADALAQMFTGETARDNVEAWQHGVDATYIDGGKIYTNSIVAASIAAGTITADEILAGTITADEIQVAGITIDRLSTTFSEIFDGLSTAAIDGQGSYEMCSAWATTAAASTSAEVVVKSGADKMLRLTDNNAAGSVSTKVDYDADQEVVVGVLKFKAYISAAGKTGYVGLHKSGTRFVRIIFKTDNNIYIVDSAAAATLLQAYSPATWYAIKVHFDAATGKASVFIDNVFKAQITLDFSFAYYADEIKVSTDVGPTGFTFDVDDLFVLNQTI